MYIYVCVFLLIHRYGTWYTNAYGADGFQYMRGYDPSYDAFYTDGPTVDEKWRDTYPYVPTSYLPTTQNAPDRSNIGTNRSRSGRGDTRLAFLRNLKWLL